MAATEQKSEQPHLSVTIEANDQTSIELLDEKEEKYSMADAPNLSINVDQTPFEISGELLGADDLPAYLAGGQRGLKKVKSRWQKAVDTFGIMAEASNVGIVIEMVGKWIPPLLAVGAGVLSSIAGVADPLIYFFRSLVRLTRIVGRNYFDITFEEEKYGTHKYQTAADIFSLTLFSLSIALFAGLIIASPVGITVAWALAITGLSVVGHFDYAHQEKLAKNRYDAVKNDDTVDDLIKEKLHKDFVGKRNSKRLFIALLIGLSFLLLCGSAAVFAPPALVPILFIASKVASGYLGLIACGRFYNWFCSRNEPTVAEDTVVTPTPANSPTSSAKIITMTTSQCRSSIQNTKQSAHELDKINQDAKLIDETISLRSRSTVFGFSPRTPISENSTPNSSVPEADETDSLLAPRMTRGSSISAF